MSTMVVTGIQFNKALEEINASYAKQNARIESLVARVEALENPPKPLSAAEKKAAEKAEKEAKAAAEAALEELSDIADR